MVENLPSQLAPGSIALLLQNLSKNSVTSACLCSVKTKDVTDGDKETHFHSLFKGLRSLHLVVSRLKSDGSSSNNVKNEKRKLHSALKSA